MITTKQRNKSYRVAQRVTGMRVACKIKVRSLTSDYSSLSVTYPNAPKLHRKFVKKEVCPVISEGDGTLFVVPRSSSMVWNVRTDSDWMTVNQAERSVGR